MGISTEVTRSALPPMPVTDMGAICVVFHSGLTLSGEMRETSANESGPTVSRVAECRSTPQNALNTPTRLADALW